MAPGLRPALLIAAAMTTCLIGCGTPTPPDPSGSGGHANAPAETAGGSAPSGSPAAADVEMPQEPEVPASVKPGRVPDKPLTVGVSLLTRAHQFYKDMEAAMLEEAGRQNITLKIQSAEQDGATQMRQVQTFVSQSVDALILCPVNSQGSGSAVTLANEAKIPVFTADIASKAGDVVCHVASNNEQGGELVGQYLAKQLDGKGEIAIIDFPVVTSVQERVRGFEKAIARYPGLKVVAKPAPAQALRARAFPIAQDLLQSRPNLRGIFGINDDCALGAVQAASATSREDLVVVGFDATPEAVEYIRKGGVLKADAAQFPGVIGRAVVQAVAKHAIGETVPASVPINTGLVRRRD